MEERVLNAEKNTLLKLAGVGQSVWYDNIERRLIKNGKFKELFDNGILGVTSNPSIFEKAISGSREYDASIKELASQGKNAIGIYDVLTMEDVSAAADLLSETYAKTNGLDGYVSIEVLPELAHNARETVRQAKGIFKQIGKPNIMIKVPGTSEAPYIIRMLTKEGINVNVTLLFSTAQYEQAARAYIEGLNDRLREKNDINAISSVASVFVSRIDTKIDGMLEGLGDKKLKGRIALSNAKMIYQKFKEIFYGEEFKKLASSGANAQRVLWASTSTKNPLYSDVKYVEELVGFDTVNTIPPKTIEAFLDHGRVEVAIEEGLDRAEADLENLKSLGIDINEVCRLIQDEGIAAFQNSFDNLIRSIEKKARK